jgi:RNA polymerase sigma-70 factor (ECF subfamily)
VSIFPQTPTTLLTRIAMHVSGEDESVWTEFFELYEPAMCTYLISRGVNETKVEDIVQDVFVKLVDVLRKNSYDKTRSRFRTYLSHLLYNEMVDQYRRAQTRMEESHIPFNEEDVEIAPTAGDALDREWIEARHRAVVKHILEKTAISDQSKRVYRELESSGDTCEAVAKRLGLKASAVRQIKSRVGRMVAALEKRFGE